MAEELRTIKSGAYLTSTTCRGATDLRRLEVEDAKARYSVGGVSNSQFAGEVIIN